MIILKQVADLHQMQEESKLTNEWRYFGITGPHGESWYNFDPFSFLERGTEGYFGGYLKEDDRRLRHYWDKAQNKMLEEPVKNEDALNWIDVAGFLYCGQIYE